MATRNCGYNEYSKDIYRINNWNNCLTPLLPWPLPLHTNQSRLKITIFETPTDMSRGDCDGMAAHPPLPSLYPHLHTHLHTPHLQTHLHTPHLHTPHLHTPHLQTHLHTPHLHTPHLHTLTYTPLPTHHHLHTLTLLSASEESKLSSTLTTNGMRLVMDWGPYRPIRFWNSS